MLFHWNFEFDISKRQLNLVSCRERRGNDKASECEEDGKRPHGWDVSRQPAWAARITAAPANDAARNGRCHARRFLATFLQTGACSCSPAGLWTTCAVRLFRVSSSRPQSGHLVLTLRLSCQKQLRRRGHKLWYVFIVCFVCEGVQSV